MNAEPHTSVKQVPVSLTDHEIDALVKTINHVQRIGLGQVNFDVYLLVSAKRKLNQARSEHE